MFAHLSQRALALSLVAGLAAFGTASAVPLTNQFVPVAVINTSAAVGENAFGVAYDSVNDLIWSNAGSGTAHAFTPLKNLAIGGLAVRSSGTG